MSVFSPMTSTAPANVALALLGARWLAVALFVGACTAPVASVPLPAPGELSVPVWLVSHGWHVGIAVRRDDVSPALWPERDDLGRFVHLEVGWGDADFYPAPRGTVGLALKAAFASDGSVLHVAAFDAPVAEHFPSVIVEVELSRRGFDELTRFVAAAYAHDADARPIAVAPGLYGASRFYRAQGRYHVLDNSNTWTARALRAAGLPIAPSWTLTASGLVAEARRHGRVVRTAP